MSHLTLEQLEWIRARLERLMPVWSEENALEAAAEAYRRFPEHETIGVELLRFSFWPWSMRDAIDRAKAGEGHLEGE